MLRKAVIGLLSGIVIGGLAPPALAATAKGAPAPAIWRVSDADSTVYLFGTFGVLPTGGQWRSRDLAAAIDASETIWFETPIDDPRAAARASEIFSAEGRLPAGKKLSSLIGKDKWEAFARAAASAGMSVETLDGLKPWAAFIVLSSRMHAAQGINLAEGVDAAIAREAAGRGRKVSYFDSIDESLRILTAMPQAQQTALLSFLLDDWARQEEGAIAAFEAWRDGDGAATDAYLNAAMREKAPDAYARLVSGRTAALADEIGAILAGKGAAFVALNAGYMVGDDALPAALAAKGFTVERVGAAAGGKAGGKAGKPSLRDN